MLPKMPSKLDATKTAPITMKVVPEALLGF
jgi:hypothetical protein